MTRTNLAYFDGRYGYLTLTYEEPFEIVTHKAHPDRYIRVNGTVADWQLCAGGLSRGNTLSWAPKAEEMAEWFARDCNARLYKTRTGYDRARARAAQ